MAEQRTTTTIHMSEIINTLLRASSHHFIGRLGRDPEAKFLQNGNSVCNASIGINRPGSKKDDGQDADWIKLEIWGEDGQRFADTCRKGQEVHVVGRVKTDRWTDRNTGAERVALVCIVRQWQLIQQAAAPAAPAGAPAPAEQPAHLAAAGWAPNPANGTVAAQQPPAWNSAPLSVPDDDEIPF